MDSQTTFTVDIPSLNACFEIYANQKQNQHNIREAENYLAQCRQDPNFPMILLKLFEDETQSGMTRLVALIQFKNLAKEIWKIRKPSKSLNLFSDDFKQQVRVFLVKCLEKNFDRQIRRQLDDLIKIISLTDFPLQYKELVDYFISKVEYLSETIQDQHALMGESTLQALRTLKIVMTEKSPKRFGNLDEIFEHVYFKLIQGFHKFWDYFHTHLISVIENSNNNNADQVAHFLKLARRADRIYLAFLTNGCESMITNMNVLQIAGLLIQRATELTKVVQLLHSKKQHEEIYEALNKNLYKLLSGISQVQTSFPLFFKDVLSDYLELLEYIITNAEVFANQYILRATVIGLTSVIKTFVYYSEDTYILQKKKIEQFTEFQREASMKYQAYFTPEKIETLFKWFLLKLLPVRTFLSNMQEIENFEEYIETEDEQLIDEYEKLENSLYHLTLACIMSLLLQFYTVAINIVHTLCLRVVKGEVELPSMDVLDGLFSIVGLLPIVYRKKNIAPQDYLDFEAVLLFLEKNGKQNIDLAKRIPVLIHKWLDLFDLQVRTQIIRLVLGVTNSIDVGIVKYECCMCLKKALEGDTQMKLDYVGIGQQLIPIVVDLLHKLLNPQTVWGLVNLLKVLFTKTQFVTNNDSFVSEIQSLSIETLIKSDYEPLLIATADLLKIIIASFPPGTKLQAIFQLSLQFVAYQLERGRSKFHTLSLWLFIAKEYSPEQGLDAEMKALFGKYLNVLLSKNNPIDLSIGLNIVEEYLLAGLIEANDYASVINLIEETYKKTLEATDPSEELFEVKAALLGLFSSLLLIFLESNMLQSFAVFENIIVFLIKDIFNDYTGPSCQAFRVFKGSSISLINRFIILSLNGVFEIFQKYDVNFYAFLEKWVKNMNFLATNATTRLNAMAILQIIPEIGERMVLEKLFKIFVRFTLREAEESTEADRIRHFGPTSTTSVHERLRDVKDSERKKASKQSNLYLDFPLKETFARVWNEAVIKFGFNEEEIKRLIDDEGYLIKFAGLLGGQ